MVAKVSLYTHNPDTNFWERGRGTDPSGKAIVLRGIKHTGKFAAPNRQIFLQERGVGYLLA